MSFECAWGGALFAAANALWHFGGDLVGDADGGAGRAHACSDVYSDIVGHGQRSLADPKAVGGAGDSRMGAVVTPPLDDLNSLDLGPYRTLVAQAPVGVMIGHMEVPGLTGSVPASLSPAAVTLLRTGTGYGGPPFDGPVFADDLSTMKAITDIYAVPEAVLKALQAGADTALWVTNTEVSAVLDRLEAAVTNHELSMDRINDWVRRMAKAKAFNSCRH